MIELLVEFVKYLHHEESIQGTIDDDTLMREYAAEFITGAGERLARLARIETVYPAAAQEARQV